MAFPPNRILYLKAGTAQGTERRNKITLLNYTSDTVHQRLLKVQNILFNSGRKI